MAHISQCPAPAGSSPVAQRVRIQRTPCDRALPWLRCAPEPQGQEDDMQTGARYCIRCGGRLERRPIEGRSRLVCVACGDILYQNPLPVASALVLSERRELLLVRRRQEPQKGMWCLPIGFAELGETIAEAALRELREEAGLEGRILGLLDTDSYRSDFYGDLLIVTFEVAKTGGSERAGDDADDVRYFPLDAIPPLAFEANEKALAACLARHRDEWAIGDSFRDLQAGRPGVLLSDALVRSVEAEAELIAEAWLSVIRTHRSTPAYRRLREGPLREHAQGAIRRFTHWIGDEGAGDSSGAFFRAAGAERRAQDVPLDQALSALSLLRKQIFLSARAGGVWAKPLEAYRVLELDRRILLFFDRAMVHLARGYADPSFRER
ncbi:MAG: NUDIX domain-containing protein [Candidatus Eisenbacteria bacterium]|nr:NUDIX domain-containing protein [Candidatus Eisenbacteria bacterium]